MLSLVGDACRASDALPAWSSVKVPLPAGSPFSKDFQRLFTVVKMDSWWGIRAAGTACSCLAANYAILVGTQVILIRLISLGPHL